MMPEDGEMVEGGDEYDDVVSSLKKQDAARAPLKRSFFAAGEIGQDKAAKAYDLSQKTGIPAGDILPNLDDVAKKMASPSDADYDDLVKKAPKLGGWLRDPINAGAVQSDLEALKTIEQMLAEQKAAPLKRRPDDKLLAQAKAIGDERAAAEFPHQTTPSGVDRFDRVAQPRFQTQQQMAQAFADEEFKRLRGVEDFVSGEGEIGGMEMLAHKFGENPLSGVPFGSSAVKIGNLGNVIAAANRYDAGTPTKRDLQTLEEHARIMLAHEVRGTGVGAKIAESGLGITEFAGEVMATAGFGAAGKKLVLKGVEEASEGLLKRVLGKFVASAVQLPAAGITAIPAAVLERNLPTPKLGVDDDGNLTYSHTQGEGLVAVPKAIVGRFADQFSAELFGLWSKKMPGASMEAFKKSIAKEGAVEVLKFIGMGEVSQLIKEVSMVEPWRVPLPIRALYEADAREELLATTVVGASMGGYGAFRHNLNVKKAHANIVHENVIRYSEFLDKAGETVKAMEAQKKSPAAVQAAIGEMVKDSGSEYDYVSAAKWEEVYGQKAREFAAEVTGKPNAFDEAGPTGQLQIPKAAVIAKIAAGDQAKLFQGEIRPDPMMPTISEAKKRLQDLEAMEAKLKADKAATPEKEINPKDPGPGDVKDFASIVGKDVAIQAEQAGRPKKEAGYIGKLVEQVYRIFGLHGEKQPEDLANEVGPLIQKGGEGDLASGNRGSYTPPDILKNPGIIRALKNPDPSTIPHELSHHFLEILAGNKDLKPMFEKFLDWRKLTAEQWDKMTLDEKRPHHEALAEEYPKWLFKGEAPTKELRNVFFGFREMLGNVYGEAANKGMEIAPEARDLFERMHATDSEIAEARERLERMEPHLLKAKSIILDAKSASEIAELMADSHRAATERLNAEADAKNKRDQSSQTKEARKIATEEATAEVDARREQIALAHLERGTKPDGTQLPIEQGPPLKLSREALKEKWSAKEIKDIPEAAIVDKGGVSPDFAAEEFGFTSGDHLIKELGKVEPRDQAIRRETDRRMYEGAQEQVLDLTEEARKAIHNDSEQKLNLYQMEWIAKNKLPQLKDFIKRLSNPKRYIKEVREYAEESIGNVTFREANPRMYERGEMDANRAAGEALSKGDFQGFIAFMELVVLNAEKYRAAVSAREEAGKIQAKMKKTRTSDYRSEIFTANPEHLAQIDALNDQYSFSHEGVQSIEKKAALRDFVESLTEDNYIVNIPDRVLNAAYKTNWKDIPLAHLAEISDTVDHIAHLAKLKNELIAKKEKRQLDTTVKANVEEIVANSKGKLDKPVDSYDPDVQKKRDKKELVQELIKDSTLLREMAGFKDGGALWESIQRPIDEAGTNEALRTEKTGKEWKRIFDNYTKAEQMRFFDKEYIPEIKGSMSRMNIMMTGLLYAQEGAAKRFLDGRGWGPEAIKAILDRLTKKDVQWINEMGALLNSNKAEVKAQMERATGLPAKMVEGAEIDTPAGKINGNYAPFKYDARVDLDTAKKLEMEEARQAWKGAAIQATTKAGFRQARVEGVKKTLRLDFNVLQQHLREVNHDLSHYETLLDVNRILGDQRMQAAIKDHHGDQMYSHLKGWLQDIAVGDQPAKGQFEKSLNWVRQGTTTAALGLSAMQAITDPVGIFQGMRRVGIGWVMKGLGRWLGDATKMENTVKWIHEVSPTMQLRSKTWIREVNEISNQISGKSGGAIDKAKMYADMGLDAVTGGKVDIEDVHNTYYWMASRMQMLQDVPTWLGMYEKSMDQAPKEMTHEAKHDRAVAMADRAVLDAFGGGQIKDLAPIQKGSASKKLWTTFYSFASTTTNAAYESVQQFRKAKSAASFGKMLGDLSMLYVLPSILLVAIKEAASGDDDGITGRKALEEIASSLLGSVPGAREMTSAVRGNDYSGPAGARIFGVVGKSIKSAIEGKPDLKAINQAAGILLHYPSAQIQRLIDGIVSWDEGRSFNPVAPIFGPKRRSRR